MEPRRRRSPGWVRALSDREVHGIAFRLERLWQQGKTTDRQEWLWHALISELEWRRAHHPRPAWACACRLCIPPFEGWEDVR